MLPRLDLILTGLKQTVSSMDLNLLDLGAFQAFARIRLVSASSLPFKFGVPFNCGFDSSCNFLFARIPERHCSALLPVCVETDDA